ncbi:MAG: hypothetical protein CMM56_05150 [Rhodospirillaceae bacterium]|nr:hypothetical protein [Rhodospirillaceae bacterium]|tara:strand:- start:897 stop:1307 length:411 start_codon:yes stop_codon:yes gene_type:complete
MVKGLLALSAVFVATVIGSVLAFELKTASIHETGNEAWAHQKMEFVSWNNERWTAWVKDDSFEHTPESSGYWHRHSNPSLAFIDWNGEPWQAKIAEDSFVIANRGDWSMPTETVEALHYLDWSGQRQIRTLAQLSR